MFCFCFVCSQELHFEYVPSIFTESLKRRASSKGMLTTASLAFIYSKSLKEKRQGLIIIWEIFSWIKGQSI